MVTRQIKLADPQETVRLLGEQDARLRELERDFGVEIVVRQDGSSGELHLNVRGSAARVEKAARPCARSWTPCAGAPRPPWTRAASSP